MKRLSPEKEAGILLTVIAHLAALIVLLATGLGHALSREQSFVLDFTNYEQMQAEIERLERQAAIAERINRRLEGEIAAAGGGGAESEVRNVAVDRAALRDDRGTDAEQLYRDAERLQQELAEGYELPQDDNTAIAAPETRHEQNPWKEEAAYSGPSVISYELEGRKASTLPIPAYRCMGGGQVTVIITVNPGGDVISAKVDESVSSQDACLRSYAVRAARMSRFSIKADAPARQTGSIVYEFIAQ